MIRPLSTLHALFVIAALTGCTLKQDPSARLRIAVPQSESAPAFALIAPPSALTTGLIGIANPLVPTDFHCFGLNVTGDGIPVDPTIQACSAADSLQAGITTGLTPLSGGVTEVIVPIGTARTVQLYVVQSRIGCPADPATVAQMLSGTDIGVPYEVGRTTVDVIGDMAIDINASWDPLTPKKAFCSDGIGTPTALALNGTTSAITTDCSVVSVSSVDSQGNLASLPASLPVTLSSSGGGTFYSDAACTTPLSTSLVLSAGSSTGLAYYQAGSAGAKTLTAAALGLTNGTHAITVTVPPPVSLALTGSATVSAGGCQAYTITSLDSASAASNVLSATTAVVTSNSGNLILYPSAGCATGGAGSLNVAIASGTSTATFYAGGSIVGAYNLSVADQAAVLTGANLPVSIATGTASQLVFSTQPSSTGTAGTDLAIAPVVQVLDTFGNLAAGATDSITLSAYVDAACTTPAGSLGAGTNPLAASSGVASFTNVSYTVAQTVYLRAAATGLTAACSSAIVISPSAPDASASTLVASPTTGINADGVSTTAITVTLRDFYNNVIPGQSVSVSATGTGNTLSPASVVSDGSGVAAFTLASSIAESKTITIATPAGLGALNASASFVSGTVSVAFSSISGTTPVIANGSATSTVTINLRDASNNPVTGVIPTFTATDTSTTNTYGACTASDGAGISTCTLASTVAESKTLSIASPITLAGSSVTFQNGPATNLLVAGIGDPTTAGASESVTVTARDAFGNIDTGYTGTIAFTSTDGSAVLPANYTFVGGDLGVHTFTAGVSLRTAGVHSVSATDTVTGTITGSQANIDVVPGAAVDLTFYTAPSTSATVGTPFAIQPIVRVLDGYGNIVTTGGYSVSLTAYIDSGCTSPSGSTLTATSNPTVSTLGDATFSGATFNGVGTIYVQASAAGLTSACSSAVTVTPGAATQLAFSAIPSTGIAGTAFGTTPVVEIQDSLGYVNTSATDTITLAAFSDASCTVPAAGTLGGATLSQSAVAGAVSYSGLYQTASGFLYLQATSGGLTPACSSAISVSPATPVILAITGATSLSVGFCETYTVTHFDSYGNIATGYSTPITLGGAGSGSFYSDNTCTTTTTTATIGSGTGTATVYFTSLSPDLLTLSVAELGGDTHNVTVNAGAADHITIASGDSQSGQVGTALGQPLVARIVDFANNPVTGDQIQFTVVSGAGTLGTPLVATDINGESSSTYTLGTNASSANTISAERSGTALPGTPSTVTFNATALAGPASIATSSITGTGPVVADGVATSTVTITLLDAFSNPIVAANPTFSASGTGNIYNSCSATDGSGVSTCSFSSTVAEAKTLQIDTPITLAGGSVTFTSTGPQSLVFLTQPSSTGIAGDVLAIQPVVEARDTSNNPLTSLNTGAVHLSVSTSPTCDSHVMSVDPANAVAPFSSGWATFTNVAFKAPMTVYLLATSQGFAPACSGAITLSQSGPATFDFWIDNGSLIGDCVSAGIKVGDTVHNTVTLPSPVTALLSGAGPGGLFYSDSSCTASITQVVFPAGPSTEEYIYFKATSPGTRTLTVTDQAANIQPANRQHTVITAMADPFEIDLSMTSSSGAPNTCFENTATLKDPSYAIATTPSGLTLNLGGTGGVTFHSDPACTSGPISAVMIAASQSSVQFWHKQTNVGHFEINVNAPGGEVGPGKNDYVIETNATAPVMLTFKSSGDQDDHISVNSCQDMVLIARDANYDPAIVPVSVSLSLSVLSGTGVAFYTDNTCTTTTNSATFPAGSSVGIVYIKGTTQGEISLAVSGATDIPIAAETMTYINSDTGGGGGGPYARLERYSGGSMSGGISFNQGDCVEMRIKTYQGFGSTYNVIGATSFDITLSGSPNAYLYTDSTCTSSTYTNLSVSVPASSNESTPIWVRGTTDADLTFTLSTTDPAFSSTGYSYYLIGANGTGSPGPVTQLKLIGDMNITNADCKPYYVRSADNWERANTPASNLSGFSVSFSGGGASGFLHFNSDCSDTGMSSVGSLSISTAQTQSTTFYLSTPDVSGQLNLSVSYGGGGGITGSGTSVCVGTGCGGSSYPYYADLDGPGGTISLGQCHVYRLKAYQSSGGAVYYVGADSFFNVAVDSGANGSLYASADCTGAPMSNLNLTILNGNSDTSQFSYQPTGDHNLTITTTTSETGFYPTRQNYVLAGTGGATGPVSKVSVSGPPNIQPSSDCLMYSVVSTDNWGRIVPISGASISGIQVYSTGPGVELYPTNNGCTAGSMSNLSGFSIATSQSNGGDFWLRATSPGTQINLNINMPPSGLSPGGTGVCVKNNDGTGCGGTSYPNWANLSGPSNVAISTCTQYNFSISDQFGPITSGSNIDFTVSVPGGNTGRLHSDASCTSPTTSLVSTVTAGLSNSTNFWFQSSANEDVPVTITTTAAGFNPTIFYYWLVGAGSGVPGSPAKLKINGPTTLVGTVDCLPISVEVADNYNRTVNNGPSPINLSWSMNVSGGAVGYFHTLSNCSDGGMTTQSNAIAATVPVSGQFYLKATTTSGSINVNVSGDNGWGTGSMVNVTP